MGATIYYEELTKLSEMITTYESVWNTTFDNIQTELNNFATTEHLTGAGADTMKSYMSEVHSFMLGQLKAFINEFKVNAMAYAATYFLLDLDAYAILDISTLEKCSTDFTNFKSNYETEIANMNTALGTISEIYTPPFFLTTFLPEDFQGVADGSTSLKEMVVTHEYTEASVALTTAEYLETITTTLNTISEGNTVSLDSYNPGDIESLEFYEALYERRAYAEEYAAVNAELYDAYAEVAQPYIDYVNAVEDRVPNAINNFLTGTTCVVAAVSVCLASGGTALPVITVIVCGSFATAEYSEGINNIILGYQQDGTSVAFNYIRDTIFQGDQTKYNIAMSVATTVPGMFTGGVASALTSADTYGDAFGLAMDIYGELKDEAEGGGSGEFDSYDALIPGDFSIGVDEIENLESVLSFMSENGDFLVNAYGEMEEAVLQMQNGTDIQTATSEATSDIGNLFYDEYIDFLVEEN